MAIVLNVASRLLGYQPRESDIFRFLMVRTMISNCFLFTNGVNDYLDDEVADMDKASIIQEYLDKLEYAIGRVDADVLAHFLTMAFLFDVTVDELKLMKKAQTYFPEND